VKASDDRHGRDFARKPFVITAGLGGVDRHGSVALVEGARLMGVCQQERVTRVRNAGFNASGLPDEALDALLQCHGRSRDDVGRYVVAGTEHRPGQDRFEHVEHHLAHASTAYLSSPFSSATIVVCDGEAPKISVWRGAGGAVSRVDWPWSGPGFTDVYSRFARAMGFNSTAGEQRFEALARLAPDSRDSRVDELVTTDGVTLSVHPDLEASIAAWLASSRDEAAPRGTALAAALQTRLGEVFVEFLTEVRARTQSPYLCLGGSFFYHSSMNTLAKRAGRFDAVFVPVDPGDAGLAVGTALHASGGAPQFLSPFSGPSYKTQEIKDTLDNCKLQYEWQSEEQAIHTALRALKQHTLVAWFDGAMEWGPRALGARCILANPFAPYVLENLNHFLKRREPWRGYAISGLEEAVATHFDGPARTPFMEGDYRPREPRRFANALPACGAAIRVQTVGTEAPSRFRRLLAMFGEATGLPFLVNTSFNGFHEPIVCSPRDAVRVFYGSGLDVLVLDQFVLRK
jgi:carbamoyltransferase